MVSETARGKIGRRIDQVREQMVKGGAAPTYFTYIVDLEFLYKYQVSGCASNNKGTNLILY